MKLVISLLILVLLGTGVWFYMMNSSQTPQTNTPEATIQQNTKLSVEDPNYDPALDLESDPTFVVGDPVPQNTENTIDPAGTQLVGSETPEVDNSGNPLIGGDAVAPEQAPGEVSFTVLGGNYYYDIQEIKVKEGDTVTINFRSAEGYHDWVVDEFGAATQRVQTDDEASVTFVADKKGTFEYYCSVGSHRAQGMVGSLIVE